jgi:uncharacterized Zn-finger protein
MAFFKGSLLAIAGDKYVRTEARIRGSRKNRHLTNEMGKRMKAKMQTAILFTVISLHAESCHPAMENIHHSKHEIAKFDTASFFILRNEVSDHHFQTHRNQGRRM